MRVNAQGGKKWLAGQICFHFTKESMGEEVEMSRELQFGVIFAIAFG